MQIISTQISVIYMVILDPLDTLLKFWDHHLPVLMLQTMVNIFETFIQTKNSNIANQCIPYIATVQEIFVSFYDYDIWSELVKGPGTARGFSVGRAIFVKP